MRSAALLLLLLPALPAAAQEPLETKLVVTQAGQEIGREEFTLRPSRARGLPGSTIIAAARYPVDQSDHPAGRHARAHPGSGAGQVPARRRERGRGHRDPRRRLRRTAHRPDRGQGLRVRPRAARRPRRRAAGRRGLLALPRSGRPRDARGTRADRDLSPLRANAPTFTARRDSGRPAAPSTITMSGDIAGMLVTDAAGPPGAAGAAGQGHSRHAEPSRTPSPSRYPTARNPWFVAT